MTRLSSTYYDIPANLNKACDMPTHDEFSLGDKPCRSDAPGSRALHATGRTFAKNPTVVSLVRGDTSSRRFVAQVWSKQTSVAATDSPAPLLAVVLTVVAVTTLREERRETGPLAAGFGCNAP